MTEVPHALAMLGTAGLFVVLIVLFFMGEALRPVTHRQKRGNNK